MLKINAPTQFFCFSQKLTYLNTAFSLTFVEERIGCSLEEYAEKEKKHLSRKKRKAAWNPEVGERNSTDLTDSPQKRERKNLENLAKKLLLSLVCKGSLLRRTTLQFRVGQGAQVELFQFLLVFSVLRKRRRWAFFTTLQAWDPPTLTHGFS